MEMSTWYLLGTLLSIRNLPDCWVSPVYRSARSTKQTKHHMEIKPALEELKSRSPSSTCLAHPLVPFTELYSAEAQILLYPFCRQREFNNWSSLTINNLITGAAQRYFGNWAPLLLAALVINLRSVAGFPSGRHEACLLRPSPTVSFLAPH